MRVVTTCLTVAVRFVVVNGPPGSGKSTLAAPLAVELGIPLLAKDIIKEALGESLPLSGAEWSGPLSVASFEVMWALAEYCPHAVLEGNFYPAAVERLQELDPEPLEIFCRCPTDVCRDRFAKRMAEDGRHSVHPPSVPPLEFFEQFATPLGIGPVVEVQTHEPVDVTGIVEWIDQQHVFLNG